MWLHLKLVKVVAKLYGRIKPRRNRARYVADSVNRGISTAGRRRAACTIGLSINEDLKLKKRKGKDK